MGDSTWTTERVPPDPAAAVVHVHGEDDDALRIVAELALEAHGRARTFA